MTVVVAMQLTSGALAPIAGRLIDQFSLRWLIVGGACCCALALALAARAQSIAALTLIYASLFGVGSLLCGPLAAQTLAARWFNARRGTAIGLSAVGTSLGGMLIPPLVGMLLAGEDWRTVHDYLALLTLLAILPPVLILVRDSPMAAGVAPEPAGPETRLAPDGRGWTVREILSSRDFRLIAIAVTPVVTATGAMQQNLAPFAADQLIPADTVATLIAVLAGVMILGKIFFGVLSDRGSQTLLLGFSVTCVYLSLGLMLLNPHLVLMYVIVAVLGFGMGGFLPLLGAIVARRFGPVAFGSVMGLLGPFVTLGAVGPLLAGYLRDVTGGYDAAVLTLMGLMVVSVIALPLLAAQEHRSGR